MRREFRKPRLKPGWKSGARTIRDLALLSKIQAARHAVGPLEFPTDPNMTPKDRRVERVSKMRQLHARLPAYHAREMENNVRMATRMAMNEAGIRNPHDRRKMFGKGPELIKIMERDGDPMVLRASITRELGLKKAGDFLIFFIEGMKAFARLEPKDSGQILLDEVKRRIREAHEN